MYPVLFTIPLFGGITIYSYGVMVALGFIAGMSWVAWESKRQGQDPGRAMDLVFYIILSAIVGSRVLDVLVSERERFFENPLMIFKIWEGGLVFYGGLIAALLVAIWYIRRHRMPLLLTFDIFSPAIAIGHAIGRLGCLLAGCCYGRAAASSAWYTLTFPTNVHSFAPGGQPLYPTQPIESIGEFLNFLLLMLLTRRKRFNGQIFSTYLMLYAVLRAVGEQFRGDVSRGFVVEPWLSTSSFISILIFGVGVVFYVECRRKAKHTRRASGGAMRRTALLIALGIAMLFPACTKPLATARIAPDMKYETRSFGANANDTYYAVRWALNQAGCPVATEDLASGSLTTKWMPVTADSHYIELFGERDFGVTNSYYQLDVRISTEGGRSQVQIGARAKTLAANFKSSGIMEQKVLDLVGSYLRTSEPEVTNLGISE